MTDVRVENHGTIAMITPLTSRAREWVAAHVYTEPWQWLGASFAAGPRYVEGLASAMAEDGLTLEG